MAVFNSIRLPQLDATLGRWHADEPGPVSEPRKVKPALVTGPAKIVLIDMPGQVQSTLVGGLLVDLLLRRL